ncbi:MAG: hypothetical protein D6689_02850 [Deltaproteobacteria bacterium]|nr:MAG: hypothetical protein D6689_02850 [Deltaproteobacteria bacterium]
MAQFGARGRFVGRRAGVGHARTGTLTSSVRLGELLIAERVVTAEQVDEALRAQVLYGGRIGTNLIELGHAAIDAIADALGRQHALAAAYSHHFESADRKLQRRIAPAAAAEHAAIPLREEVPGVVAVAFLDPPPPESLRALSSALGAEIVPVIAPELRLRYQLELVYGIPRPTRFVRPQPRAAAPTGQPAPDPPRRYLRTLSDAEPDRPAGTLGRLALRQRAVARDAPSAPAEAEQVDAAADPDAAIRGIRRATDRDRVVDLLISCMRDGFGRQLGVGLVLLARGDVAFGWRGFSDHAGDDVVASIAIPLDEPSVLQLAHRTGVLVCGRPPPAGARIDERLWHLLGSGRPAECVVAPVKIQDKVACLLYAHARNLGPLDDDVAHDIGRLAEATGRAFVRLIRSFAR